MKAQKKRIFISDLPEGATQSDVEIAFKDFGNVISVDIKKRKELIKNNSFFFAYVNVEIDDRNLQQCFNHFANKKWFGQNVVLQIARESFLDRLKREREENDKKNTAIQENPTVTVQHNISNGVENIVKKYKFSESESLIENCDTDSVSSQISRRNKHAVLESGRGLNHSKDKSIENSSIAEDTSGLIIKNNKGKVLGEHGLKIESVGKDPIIIHRSKQKFNLNSSEANLKRLNALNNLKKNYKSQKSVIQTALSQIDTFSKNSKNKIIFDLDDNEDAYTEKTNDSSSKKHLFDENQSEDESNVDFTVKEQFQGKEGHKLLSLQSRYKNDKRFTLDSRFVDDKVEDEDVDIDNEENSLRKEKKMEYEILGQILGKDVSNSKHLDEKKSPKKTMLRFDPTQPEHSKFEIRKEVKKGKKQKNKLEEDLLDKKQQEEKEVPEVSKETFYKVTDNLKETLHEKQEFSLLSMFGKKDDLEDLDEQMTDVSPKIVTSNKFINERNPFRYDSSDDEDQTHNIPTKNQNDEQSDNQVNAVQVKTHTQWSEPFFFKYDDYRLQEGFDFIEKMKVEEKTEFSKLRRDLKEIVKAKVRNNQRKHKPFKKKLGGNKRKKMIRMKKALKR